MHSIGQRIVGRINSKHIKSKEILAFFVSVFFSMKMRGIMNPLERMVKSMFPEPDSCDYHSVNQIAGDIALL